MSARQIALETRPRPLHAEDGDVPGATNNGANGNGRPKRLPTISGRVVDPSEISAEVEEMGAEEAIAWAIENFGSRLGFAVSFQKTSSVIIDIAHRIDPTARFFYLDTELLFPETYETRDALADRYGIEFERFVRTTRSGFASAGTAGEPGARTDDCCAIRKVEAMREGARRDASAGSRASAGSTRRRAPRPPEFGWDKRFGLLEAEPAGDWDDKAGLELHQGPPRPYNPLHDQGYPSIGCMPCTTSPASGRRRRAPAAGPAPTGPSAASTGSADLDPLTSRAPDGR